jgi:ribonuclease HI
VGEISYPYPCPSGTKSTDIRARGQNCHPYPA